MTVTEELYQAACKARNDLAYKCGWFEGLLDALKGEYPSAADRIARSLAALDKSIEEDATE